MSTTPRKVPSYRLHKPTGQGVVRLGGRDIYLGKHGTPESHERYRRTVAEWLSTGTPPTQARRSSPPADGTGSSMSVNELVLAFWKYAEGHYRRADGSPTTEIRSYRATLEVVTDLYGMTPARDFSPKCLKAVRAAMVDKGICRKTTNQRVGRIVRMFKWAVEAELAPPSVYHGLTAVKPLQKRRTEARESEPVRPAPEEYVDAIRTHVDPRVWAMVELQRVTGMRPGEVVLLRLAEIDRTGPVWEFKPSAHKMDYRDDRDRVIYLGPRAQEILRPWLKADPEAYLFSPMDALNERATARRAARKTPLTPSQRARRRKKKPERGPGERYTTRSYYHAIRRGCAKAFPHPTLGSIPEKRRSREQWAEITAWNEKHGWHPNQLRHSAATYLRKTFGLDVARCILGHTSPAVTLIYAEADREKAREVMGKVG